MFELFSKTPSFACFWRVSNSAEAPKAKGLGVFSLLLDPFDEGLLKLGGLSSLFKTLSYGYS